MERGVLSLLVAVLLGPIAAFGGVVVHQRIESPHLNGTITIRTKGDKARLDVRSSDGVRATMLMDFDTGDLTQLLPKQKQALKLSHAQFEQAASHLKAALNNTPKPPPPRNSGRTAKISGYKTQIYDWTNVLGAKIRLWVAKNFPNYKTVTAQLEKVNEFTSPDVTKGRISPDTSSLPGMVVKERDIAGTNVTTTTLVSAKEKDVPASVFTIPAGYHVIDVQKEESQAARTQSELVAGRKFPDFKVSSVKGKTLSLADYKGKVVLIDFWATWCPPCRAEVPDVVATYKKYHEQGFDIIGVSLDQEKQKLLSFTKEHGMTWPQYFDGQGWQNELAQKYGIRAIPATFLLNTNGVIIAKDLRGEALEQAVGKAVSKK